MNRIIMNWTWLGVDVGAACIRRALRVPVALRAFVAGVACLGLALAAPAAGRAATVAADDDIDRYDTTVAVDARGNDAFQRVRLPIEVLRHSRSERFADIRVVDARGNLLPMAWVRTPPPAPPRVEAVALPFFAWPKDLPPPLDAAHTQIEWTGDGSTLRIRRDAARATTLDTGTAAAVVTAPAGDTANAVDAAPAWLVDLQPLGDRRALALRLDWSSRAEKGLVRLVRVAASSDARQWRDVGRAALVEWQSTAAPQGGVDARQVLQRRVALETLPPGTRWLRVQAEGALALESLAAEFDLRTHAPAVDADAFDSARFDIRPDGFDLGATLALRRIDFEWPEGSSTVTSWRLEREVAPHWLMAAQGTSWKLERGGEWLRSEAVDIEAGAARRWRVVALPQTPTLPGEVKVQWLAPQLVFVASGRSPYRLVLGRAGAADRSVPLETLVPGYRSGEEHRLPLASLGSIDSRPLRDRWDWKQMPGQRIALWAALALAVAVLAWMAWQLARDMTRDGARGDEGS